MVQLIKKGGLRERANRSRTYQGSENTETTLKPNTYKHAHQNASDETTSHDQKLVFDGQTSTALNLSTPTHAINESNES